MSTKDTQLSVISTIFTDPVHCGNILQKLWVKCENEDFCDVVLVAGAEQTRIPAHRSILTVASEYFNGMFNSSMRDSHSKDVPISSADGEILKLLIGFCYTGSVVIKETNVVEMLKMADMLLLESVVKACGNFLAEQLHPTNSLGFALLAERYKCQSLLSQAKEFSLEHFEDIYEMDEFLNLSAQQLGELLSSDNLCATNEKDVFQSLMRWIQHDPAERETHKFDLLKLVRMPLLDASFLMDHVAPVCISTSKCHQLVLKAMEWHLVPDDRTPSISRKSRKRSDEVLMAITRSNDRMYIHYYRLQRLKWMKWPKVLEYRTEFGLALIDDTIYIVGGRNADFRCSSTVYCLNLKSMTSNYAKPMPEARIGFRVAVLGGCLYLVGGQVKNDKKNTVEKYDPKTNAWTKVAPMSIGRSFFDLAQLNEKLYVFGEQSNECYNPHKNCWEKMELYNVDEPHSELSPGLLSADHRCSGLKLGLPIVGNRYIGVSLGLPSAAGIRYSGVAVAKGHLYFVGRKNSGTAVDVFHPEGDYFMTISNLRERMHNPLLCTTFRDKVIVCYSNRIEEYNPGANEWQVGAHLKGLNNVDCVFSYSNNLLMSEFIEN